MLVVTTMSIPIIIRGFSPLFVHSSPPLNCSRTRSIASLVSYASDSSDSGEEQELQEHGVSIPFSRNAMKAYERKQVQEMLNADFMRREVERRRR